MTNRKASSYVEQQTEERRLMLVAGTGIQTLEPTIFPFENARLLPHSHWSTYA
jgi:hypothetical protein